MRSRTTLRGIQGLALAIAVTTAGLVSQVPCPGEPRAEVPDTHVVIEGDIIVPTDHCLREGLVQLALWPGGLVPYEFEGGLSSYMTSQALLAMGEWEAVASVWFVPRTTELSYLYIQNANTNSSHVGRQGNRQVINVANWQSVFVIAHELGHALGYWHEQSRPDRDSYIQVNYSNVQAGQEHNFDTRQLATYGPYDFESVMHYDECAFSINCVAGSPCSCSPFETITVLPPNQSMQSVIGQTAKLSEWDGKVMSFLYPAPGWVFVDPWYAAAANGTFGRPYPTLSQALNAVPSGGDVWVLVPSVLNGAGTYRKPVTIRAALGSVTLR